MKKHQDHALPSWMRAAEDDRLRRAPPAARKPSAEIDIPAETLRQQNERVEGAEIAAETPEQWRARVEFERARDASAQGNSSPI